MWILITDIADIIIKFIMATTEFVKQLLENDNFKKLLKSMNEDTARVIKDNLDGHTKRTEEMERRHLKRIEDMESEHQAKIEQMEQNIHKMEETQKYRMINSG